MDGSIDVDKEREDATDCNPLGLVWFSDGVHYLMICQRHDKTSHVSPDGVVFSVSEKKPGRIVNRIPDEMKWIVPGYSSYRGSSPPIEPGRIIVTRTGLRTTLIAIDDSPRKSMQIAQWPIDSKSQEVRTTTIQAPPETEITQLRLSPEGDRVAYLVSGTPHPPLPDFVYRVLPILHKPAGYSAL